MAHQPITPSECLGIIGGGQLGRMFSIAAKQMGYKVAILEPQKECPAYQFADYFIETKYEDKNGLDQLAKYSKVVTTEFENVPAQSLEYLGKYLPVYPDHRSVLICQNRLHEKQFFNQLNIKTTQFCPINNEIDIDNLNINIFPSILKTNTLGYDGKGQIKVNNIQELKNAFTTLNGVPCILEQLVDLKFEVSIIVARNHFETKTYPVVTNNHINGILDTTSTKVNLNSNQQQQINDYAISIINKLDYIGILAIEFFITKDDKILANEMAPRPHNSGHYTLNACVTSQFEQQVRSICNLKLGSTELLTNAIMLNLLGDIWQNTNPDWAKILKQYDNIKLHLYEKQIAKPGRKMGHLNIIGKNIEHLTNDLSQIKHALNIKDQ